MGGTPNAPITPGAPMSRAKDRMGYQPPFRRPSCCNCFHAVQVVPTGAYNDMHHWRCNVGGFGVAAQAVCQQHQPLAPLAAR
jgi:hypothetical protein